MMVNDKCSGKGSVTMMRQSMDIDSRSTVTQIEKELHNV